MMRGGPISPKLPYVQPPPNQSAVMKSVARRQPLAGAAEIAELGNMQHGATYNVDAAAPLTLQGIFGWNRQPGCTCRIWAAATGTSSSMGNRRMEIVPRSDGCMPAAAPRPAAPPLRKFEGATTRLGLAGVEASLRVQVQFGGEELRLGRLAEGEVQAAQADRRLPRPPDCAKRGWPGTSPTWRRERPRGDDRRMRAQHRHRTNVWRHCGGGSPPAPVQAAPASATTSAALATSRRIPSSSARRRYRGHQRRRRLPLLGTLDTPREPHQLVAT